MTGSDDLQLSLKKVYDDLCGIHEVNTALGINSMGRIREWVKRREHTKCPDPVAKLACGHIYSMIEWRVWYAAWSEHVGSGEAFRKGGRPKRPWSAPQRWNPNNWRT